MIDKRLFLALSALALLAACGGETTDEEEGAATGEVLEGTISDAMLPLDRVRSEAPLEDPEAFVEAQSEAGEAGAEAIEIDVDGEDVEPAEAEDTAAEAAPVAEPTATEPE